MEHGDVFLSLGTNLGDRVANLETAVKKLNTVFGPPLSQSRIIETEACGFEGPAFLNTVIKYNTYLSPYETLSACKRIEKEMGREDLPEFDENGRRIYHDRIIDIDILKYGDIALSTPELTLPHPQIKTRPYILPLLMEIEGK